MMKGENDVKMIERLMALKRKWYELPSEPTNKGPPPLL